MHPPPAHTGTGSLPDHRQVTDTDVTSKREAVRLLRGIGLTGAEAHRMYDAYRADLERPVVTAGASYSRGFLAWLQRTPPGGLPPRVRRWRVGEGQWRTS